MNSIKKIKNKFLQKLGICVPGFFGVTFITFVTFVTLVIIVNLMLQIPLCAAEVAIDADPRAHSNPHSGTTGEPPFQFDPQRVQFTSDLFEVFATDHKQRSHLEGHLQCTYEGIQWKAAGLQFYVTDAHKLKQNVLRHGTFVSSLEVAPPTSKEASKAAIAPAPPPTTTLARAAQQPVIFDSRSATLPNWNMLFLFQAEQMDVKLRVEGSSFYYDCHIEHVQRAEGRVRRARTLDKIQSWYQTSMSAASIDVTMHLQRIGDALYDPYIQTCELSQVKNFCLYSRDDAQRIDMRGANLKCQCDAEGSLTLLHAYATKGQQVEVTIRQADIERSYQAREIRINLEQGVVKSIHTSSDSILSERVVIGAIRPCLQPQVE